MPTLSEAGKQERDEMFREILEDGDVTREMLMEWSNDPKKVSIINALAEVRAEEKN